MIDMDDCVQFDRGRPWYRRLIDAREPWVWLVYLPLYGVNWLYVLPSRSDLLISGAGLAMFVAIYIHAARTRGAALVGHVLAILFLAFALIPFGGNWSILAVYACSVAAELRPARSAAWVVAVLVLASIVAILAAGFAWYVAGMIALFEVMVVFGKMSGIALGEKHGALLRAQEEVRLLAREAERERIARDLHDLLGRTLTLIALKSDLAAKLAATNTAAAEQEMREVAEAARGGLAEVRAAVVGMTEAGLAREIGASRAALASAGIACRIEGEDLAVSSANGAVLAMALREAITNVIRHAGASSCDIKLARNGDAVHLTVSDNGQGGEFEEAAGLRGMRARLAAAGGRLAVQASSVGTRISAAVPVIAS